MDYLENEVILKNYSIGFVSNDEKKIEIQKTNNKIINQRFKF